MNQDKPTRRAIPVATKRVIARVYFAISLACLAAQAMWARPVHHSLAVTVTGIVFPVLAVLCGLSYLRQSRRQP